jgi:hypothetical protein
VAASWALLAIEAALLTFAEGGILVDSKPPELIGTRVTVVRSGQTVSTGDGRAELLFGRTDFIRLGPESRLDLGSMRLHGTALFDFSSPAPIELVCGETTVQFPRPGMYRVDCRPPAPGMLTVARGTAVAVIGSERIRTSAGRTLTMRRGEKAVKPRHRGPDEMDVWNADRADLAVRFRRSRRALVTPSDAVLTDPSDIDRALYGPRQ